jgi:hypothetical protein
LLVSESTGILASPLTPVLVFLGKKEERRKERRERKEEGERTCRVR